MFVSYLVRNIMKMLLVMSLLVLEILEMSKNRFESSCAGSRNFLEHETMPLEHGQKHIFKAKSAHVRDT